MGVSAADDVSVRDDGDVVTVGARPHGTRLRNWVVGLVAGVVFLAAVGWISVNEVRANTRFDRTHAALVTTRFHLSRVVAQLDAVRRALTVVDGQVAQDRQALGRDATQLTGIQTALSTSRTNLSRGNQTVTDLHTCLSGVEQAANALSVNDRARAIEALGSVTASCTAAVDAHG